MNPSIIRSVAFPLGVTLALLASLMPLALLLHGSLGIDAALIAGGVVAAIILLTAATQAIFPQLSAEPLKQFALVSSLRIGLSLTALLAAWVATRNSTQPEVLLYAVPLYVGLLWSEALVQTRQF